MAKIARGVLEIGKALLLGAAGGYLCCFVIFVCATSIHQNFRMPLFEVAGYAHLWSLFIGIVFGVLFYPPAHYLVVRRVGLLFGCTILAAGTIIGGFFGLILLHALVAIATAALGFLGGCALLVAVDAENREKSQR